jgi:hypothetical protein
VRRASGRSEAERLGPQGEDGWVANNSKRHGTTSMILRVKRTPLQSVNWPEAMDFVIIKVQTLWAKPAEKI